MRTFNLFVELTYILLFAVFLGWLYGYLIQTRTTQSIPNTPEQQFDFPEFRDYVTPPPRLRPKPPPHVAELINSVYEQLEITHSYDPSYVKLAYPGGDVPLETGVCSDVVIRAFRAQGIDLQQQVHEDMRRHFRKYPKKWGLRRPDTNIDHRRVPNLMTFFKRQGVSLPVSDNPDDYLPGDLVVWKLNDRQNHIGIVMQARSRDEMRPLIGHNINSGVVIQDFLFNLEIIGHYRYFPEITTQNELLTSSSNNLR